MRPSLISRGAVGGQVPVADAQSAGNDAIDLEKQKACISEMLAICSKNEFQPPLVKTCTQEVIDRFTED
jgi:hypothetical protein